MRDVILDQPFVVGLFPSRSAPTNKPVAYKIFSTEDALSDLENVLDYISAENPRAAERLGISLLNHVELLQSPPRIGVPVPGRPGIRKILHSPVRV
jgi:plasmid stabilization system protein ParE